MADKTKIEWTDASWNPVTGCDKVSPGCKHCYAETVAKKFWATQYPPITLPTGDPSDPLNVRARQFSDVQCHHDRLQKPLQWTRPRLVFVNSMSDLFHDDVGDDFIDRVFAIMALASRHTFQVLTKRPERMREYMISRGGLSRHVQVHAILENADSDESTPAFSWPLPNVWLGVSVEDQEYANRRIPLLLDTPAAVRWISAEPLLDSVDLTQIASRHRFGADYWNALTGFRGNMGGGYTDMRRLDWVVVGGESGQHHRLMLGDWARQLRDQCQAAGVAFFFKQWGGPTPKSGGRVLDGLTYSEYPA